MAKKKTRRRRATSSVIGGSSSNLQRTAVNVGSTLLGIAVGSAISGFVGKKDTVSGVDLLGLDGDTSGYVTPLITAAAGAAVMKFGGKSDITKNVGVGIMLAGGAKLVNKFAGKSVVSLNGADEEVPVPFMPGIGDVTTYESLPSTNEWETAYNEPNYYNETPDVSPSVSGVGSVLL